MAKTSRGNRRKDKTMEDRHLRGLKSGHSSPRDSAARKREAVPAATCGREVERVTVPGGTARSACPSELEKTVHWFLGENPTSSPEVVILAGSGVYQKQFRCGEGAVHTVHRHPLGVPIPELQIVVLISQLLMGVCHKPLSDLLR